CAARPHPRPYRLLPGRGRLAVLWRHPLRRRLWAPVRGHTGADAPLIPAPGGTAGCHGRLLHPRVHAKQSALRPAVEPDNPAIARRLNEVSEWRAHGRISLPSSIGLEKATNPFLRCSETSVKE